MKKGKEKGPRLFRRFKDLQSFDLVLAQAPRGAGAFARAAALFGPLAP